MPGSIPDAFAEQVRRSPDSIAVSIGATAMTYAEFDAAGNRYAHTLLERTAPGPGQVALLLEDDLPLFTASLGVLKAGKAAVVLNVSDPPGRLEQILDDAEPELLITDDAHRDVALASGVLPSRLVIADGGRSPSTPPDVRVDPGDLAWLAYTSGSTGRPKGVMYSHRGLIGMTTSSARVFGSGPGERATMFTSMSGFGGVSSLWGVLLTGGTCCPFIVADRGMTGLADWAVEQGITAFGTYPTLYRQLVATLGPAGLPPTRLVALGGEAVMPTDYESARRLFGDNIPFYVTYGSTEAGLLTTYRATEADLDAAGPLPLGRPVEGISLSVVDDDGTPVPAGDVGEIAAQVDHVALGYWRDEAFTAARFRDGVFRTGDLGRLSADGDLTLVGRRDSQVKVRGNRISLGELESTIASVPGVTRAVVCAASNDRGDTRLTGYLSTRPDAGLTGAAVREALRDALPQREMPTAFVFVDEFPVTVTGKVDRTRLVETARAEEPAPGPEPKPGTEARLAAIWADVLERDRVSADADFFDLAGDSLTAAAIAAGVHAEFGVEIELRAFVETPNVAAMAERIERQRGDATLGARPTLLRAPRTSTLPLSYAQERVWRSTQTPEGALDQNMRIAIGLDGDLDAEALRTSLERLVARHEILRTTYAQEPDDRLIQTAQPPGRLELPVHDVSGAPDPQARAREELQRIALQPFDLARDLPMRLALARLAPRKHWLLGTFHHIAFDAWSWKGMLDELGADYAAHAAGAPSPLPDTARFQYADFAVWERRNLNPNMPRYKREVAWWMEVLRDVAPRPLELPCTWEAPPAQELARTDGLVSWGFAPELSRRLDDVARDLRATAYMIRLALFAAQVALETGRDQLVIGAYMSNRRLVELQSMIGDFTNLTTLVLSFSRDLTFRAWVEHVRGVVEDTSEHSEVAYEELHEKLRRRGVAMPFISTVFGLDHGSSAPRFGDLELTFVPTIRQMAPNGLSFFSNPADEPDRSQVYFDVRTYDPVLVRAFTDRHQTFAARVVEDPDRPMGGAGFEPA